MSRLEQVMIAALAAGLAGSIGCETQRAGGAGDAQPEDRGPPETPYDGGGCTPAEQQVIPLCRLDAGPDAGPVADAGASDAGAGDGGSGDGGEGGPDDAAAPDMARPEAPPGCVPDLTGLGELSADLCYAYCGGGWNSDPICQVVAGGLECYWPEWCGVGRRPAGATPVEGATVADLGAWLGAAAGLEAAAVGAFEALAEHLRDLGAPADLVAACQAAAEDERRHTEAMRALAQRYGDDLRPWVAPTPTPSRFELALDNRLEGCVGETFGALVVAHQAQQAQD
ncbi:MAG: hypothetical protein KC613_26740, partial [Myxococcales bacterium]|nr:hypothetical protein [Myxococcales bacterium]